MKMNRNFYCLNLAFAASTLFLSCKKEQDPNGVTYQLNSSAVSATINGGAANSTLQWTKGYASVVEIEFEARSNNVEVEYESEVKKKIDLFSALTTLGVINVPSGTYEDIEFEVEVEPNGNEAALQLSGNFSNASGVVTPVTFTLNTALEIESKQTNVLIVDGAGLTALTTFNLSLITTGVTESMLDNATRNIGGVIEISATSNIGIYNIIFENLKMCGGVEVD